MVLDGIELLRNVDFISDFKDITTGETQHSVTELSPLPVSECVQQSTTVDLWAGRCKNIIFGKRLKTFRSWCL